MTDIDSKERDEEDIRRLLQAAGRREELPVHLKNKWEQQFRDAISETRAARRSRRTGLFAGLAACLAVISFALVTLREPAPQLPDIRVVTAMGTTLLSNPQGGPASPIAGEKIAPGTTLVTNNGSLVALAWGGYDLRINARSELVLNESGVILRAGEIYVSDDDRQSGEFHLNIHTPHGAIRDIGTQFSVRVAPGQTRTTVRRGAVLLDTGNTEHRAQAPTDSAVVVTMDGDGGVSSEATEASGAAWRWIYGAGSAFTLEGRSAWDFLQWSVSESGLSLDFDSPNAESYARSTILHGDLGDLDPERAVQPVLAATDLSATVANGRLLVTLVR